ncbi:hypothetical protein [Streptacidiphilus sp. PAMC 29251]
MMSTLETPAVHHLTVTQNAPHGGVFTPGCFDSWIGESIPITVTEPPFRGAAFTLLSYRLTEHGTVALLDLEAESAEEQDIGLEPMLPSAQPPA